MKAGPRPPWVISRPCIASFGPEAARVLVLGLAGVWLLHPFMTARFIGTGDALWYANMLADFVTQWRAGVFPVFVGETEYAFNGAVYPLRVAPLFQHLAGTIDLLTGRTLSFFALQHATVVACGLAGLLTSYLTLRRLAPMHPWLAVAGSILYLSCPGVLGTIYTQDLYMTWMTVPLLPLAAYGILRPFREDSLRSQAWLAAPLAALWYAHSPVALWLTLIATGTHGLRLIFLHRTAPAWRRATVGAILFAALAHYPFVSVASLNVPGATSAVTSGLAEQERITNVIREVFPAILLPLSPAAAKLSDLQLGYGLWAVGLVLLFTIPLRSTTWAIRLLVAASLVLTCLLLPVPGLTDWLWAALPEQIKRITFYWPMHRFYLLLAALLTAAGAAALASHAPRERPIHRYLALGLLVACVWSLWESRQFVRAGNNRTATLEASHRVHRPENRLLMNHAYGLFAALPDYFSNGVMDPRAEARLFNPSGHPLLSSGHAAAAAGRFSGQIDANPGILKLAPTIRLEPGERYDLEFEFPDRETRGILQISGPTFFREYALPESGQPKAFGSNPGNNPSLPLWTTASAAEEITLRFIPTGAGAKPADFADFAGFHLRQRRPGAGAVEVTSLQPFRATVIAPEDGARLESPRMYLPGYIADVDGREAPVTRSEHGLASVEIPAGRSTVTLTYRAPLPVRLSYWSALAAWGLLPLLAGTAWWRTRVRVSPS